MNQNIQKLYEEFKTIKEMGWIKTKRKGSTGIGYTFEELINKPEENFPIPDYNGIEIKTCRKYSRRDIHLFCANPDGDYLFPTQRVIYYLGYPDKTFKNVKIFNMNFNTLNYKKIGLFKEAKISVNERHKKIDFIARKIDSIPFKINTSWSYELLEKKLNLKMNYMARIIADVMIVDNVEYYHYNEIRFYKLKNFETFIDLIKKGYIQISFNIGVFKNGNRKGKIHDRGNGFIINEKYIDMLYDEIKLDFMDQES